MLERPRLLGYSRETGSACVPAGTPILPFQHRVYPSWSFTSQSYGHLSERVHAFLLAASVLTLPTLLSIFTYKHFPDFFFALHVTGVYSLSLLLLSIFLFQLWLLFPSTWSLSRTFLPTSHGNDMSDPAPLCELVLLISPWECTGVKFVGRLEFADAVTPGRIESQRNYSTWYKP